MLNQLIKIGVFVTLGLWLKHRIRGLAYLIGVLVVTWIAHNEYLSYTRQSGNVDFLELSYAVKWSVFLVSVVIYWFAVERRIRRNPDDARNTILHPQNGPDQGDGFDFLRRKKTLESEADKALKGKDHID